MLGPGLRDFDGPVAPVDGLLPHAVDLVAERLTVIRHPGAARNASSIRQPDLLHGVDRISFGTQARNAPDGQRNNPGTVVWPPGPFCECHGWAEWR